jgi:hypothetical protein
LIHIKNGAFHASYQYIDFDVIRATRPKLKSKFTDCNPSFLGMNVFQCILPEMPNSFMFDPEDSEVQDRYPLILFALGSSGIQNPGLLQYNPWIENDPRNKILPFPQKEESKGSDFTNSQDNVPKQNEMMKSGTGSSVIKPSSSQP